MVPWGLPVAAVDDVRCGLGSGPGVFAGGDVRGCIHVPGGLAAQGRAVGWAAGVVDVVRGRRRVSAQDWLSWKPERLLSTD